MTAAAVEAAGTSPQSIMMRNALTAEQLFARITKGVRFGSPVYGDARAALRGGNLDLLRCFDELMSGDDEKQCNAISRVQHIVQYEMDREASGFITQGMLDATERVFGSRVFSRNDEMHYTHTRHKFCAYVFANMDRIDEIMFLLEEREMTNVKLVEEALEEMHLNELSKPLLEGAL